MATLGELLFYIATQQQDSGAGSVASVSATWGITPATSAALARLLRPGEDETAQHYAVKTVENICCQPGEWAAKFASAVRAGVKWGGGGAARCTMAQHHSDSDCGGAALAPQPDKLRA